MIRQIPHSALEHLSFTESLTDCLTKLNTFHPRNQVLGIIFFIDSKSDSEYFRMKEDIQRALEVNNPFLPFNVQAQSYHSKVSVEIWLDDSADSVEYFSESNIRYTRVHSVMGKSIWGIGITSQIEHLPLADQIDFSFESLRLILKKEGMSLADIVRQWNYIPGILNIQDMEGKALQHYQIFNEIRQKYYSAVEFKDGYPSATGIGTRNGNFNLDFIAVQSSASIQKFGLSNPKQQDAYKYDQVYLVGDTTSGQTKKTPLFERAKLLKTEEETLIFISGTASIIGQETIGIGDVRHQTEMTINNMLELIPTLNGQSIRFTYLRAYIKYLDDFLSVRRICENRFPDVSISYLQADVCRKNLLVEIEGAAVVS